MTASIHENQQMSLELELQVAVNYPVTMLAIRLGPPQEHQTLLTKEPFQKYLFREALYSKVQAPLFEIELFHSILGAKNNLAHTMGLWCQQQQNLWHFINNHFI